MAKAGIRETLRVVRFVWTHPANHSRRLRALAAAARFQARGRVLGKPTLTKIGDRSRMWAELHRTGASRVVYANPPYWEPMQAWRAVLRRGDLFIDVGANVGAYTLWAAELGAEVIAIEPDHDSRERLEDNIALNGYDVSVLPVALAERPGSMRFTTGLDTLNRLVLDDATGPAAAVREVHVDTLDRVIGDRYVAGVKIDVAGAERLVLEGARRALSERRIGMLQLAWLTGSLKLLGEDRTPAADLLTSLGYRLYRPNGDGALLPAGERPPLGVDVFARPSSDPAG
jgi:FkbM family methyltransferase